MDQHLQLFSGSTRVLWYVQVCTPTQTCVHIHTPPTQAHIHKDQKNKRKKIELEHKFQKGKRYLWNTFGYRVTSRRYENQQEKYKLGDKETEGTKCYSVQKRSNVLINTWKEARVGNNQEEYKLKSQWVITALPPEGLKLKWLTAPSVWEGLEHRDPPHIDGGSVAGYIFEQLFGCAC